MQSNGRTWLSAPTRRTGSTTMYPFPARSVSLWKRKIKIMMNKVEVKKCSLLPVNKHSDLCHTVTEQKRMKPNQIQNFKYPIYETSKKTLCKIINTIRPFKNITRNHQNKAVLQAIFFVRQTYAAVKHIIIALLQPHLMIILPLGETANVSGIPV